ncbi:MAG TPA: hypothetical protein VMW38_04760 [Terriglobia bacterium]|nr:hypothetical protein [Terriglobia bacterium]
MEYDFNQARNSLHKLNNKIAQILVYAELLQLNLTNEKDKERVKVIISGALESRDITAKLMIEMPKSGDGASLQP